MRIDIIRKELVRRFKNIWDLRDSNEIVIREEVNKLIYFLLSTEGIREFIIDLMKFHEKFKKTDEFNKIKINIIGCVQEIVKIIEESKFTDKGVEINLRNHFDLKGQDNLPLDEYVECLKHFDKYFDDSINELSGMLGSGIANIFGVAKDKGWSYDSIKYQSAYDNLIMWYEKLKAHLKLRFQYEGAESALRLLTIFFHSQYRYLVDIDEKHLGNDLKEAIERFRVNAHVDPIETVKDCEELNHAVDKFLTTSKSKSFLIDRLLTYCKWIRKEDFPKSNKENRELKISRVVEEFLFNNGYFPLVNFKMGKSIPDILSAPGIDLRWDNSVLIELKQIIGKTSYSPSDIETDIGQAQDYLSDVKGVNPDIVDTVYLLIFYDGKIRRTIPKSIDVPDNVRVEFVYVGEETPSKLKAPNATVKKKPPKKKTAKKAIRKKKS